MNAAELATAASLAVALLALLVSSRQNLRARQLQVVFELGAEYREAWRTRWKDLPVAVDSLGGDASRLPSDQSDLLHDALNWIDWFGIACEERIIRRPDFVFRTVGPSMAHLIQAGSSILASQTKELGSDQWAGVLYVQGRLEHRGQVMRGSVAQHTDGNRRDRRVVRQRSPGKAENRRVQGRKES